MASSPTVGPKEKAAALTPYRAQGKTKQAAQDAEYHALVTDHDNDKKSAETVRQLYENYGLPALIFSTSSHTPDEPRWKVIIPFSRPMTFEQFTELANGAALLLGTDKAQSRVQQVFYVPNKLQPDSAYEYYDDTQGRTLDPLNEAHPFVSACRDKNLDYIEAQQRQAEQAKHTTRTVSQSEGQIIDRACQQFDIANELRRHGYKQIQHNLFLSPNSSSGKPGVVILLNEKDGKQRVYSHHGETDPLSNLNNAGHALDVFDVMCLLDYQGDTAMAVKAMATMVDPKGQQQRQRDHTAEKQRHQNLEAFNPPVFNAPAEADTETEHGFRFRPIGTMLQNIQPPAWLIKDIIPRDCLAVLWGVPGHGKSFIAMDLAASIATGIDWHGHRTKPGAVFYIAGEGLNGLTKRFKAWEIARQVDLSSAPLSVSSAPAAMDQPEHVLIVKQAIADMAEQLQQRPVLIVVDTLARNFSGDENSTKDMNMFVRCMDGLRHEWKASILIVHHTGKDTSRGARGSSALKAAIDTEYSATMDELKVIIMECHKMKDDQKPPPLVFKLQGVKLPLVDEDLNDIWSCTPQRMEDDYQPPQKGSLGRGKNQTKARQILAELYREHEQRLMDDGRDIDTAVVTIDDWWQRCEQSGIKRTRFNEVKKSLEEQGDIEIINPYVRLAA